MSLHTSPNLSNTYTFVAVAICTQDIVRFEFDETSLHSAVWKNAHPVRATRHLAAMHSQQCDSNADPQDTRGNGNELYQIKPRRQKLMAPPKLGCWLQGLAKPGGCADAHSGE